MCESASGCRLQSSYSTSIVLSSLKSNWHLDASCQLPVRWNWRIGIQNVKLTTICQLPIEWVNGNWQLAANFTDISHFFTICLKVSAWFFHLLCYKSGDWGHADDSNLCGIHCTCSWAIAAYKEIKQINFSVCSSVSFSFVLFYLGITNGQEEPLHCPRRRRRG